MTLRIEPYKLASEGAKELSRATGILEATPAQVRKHRDFTHIINWGSPTRKYNGTYINTPEAVRAAGSKLDTARALAAAGVAQPAWTDSRAEAEAWLAGGAPVMERKLLRASQGRGLRYVEPGGALEDAPLYTRYVKKAEEYRVHVFRDEVIDVQQKRKRQEVPNEQVNYQIRNARFGWVFCREGVDPPAIVLDTARAAVAALGLDFGAVDIGYNRKDAMAYVFEVNTAPGLEGTTLDRYRDAVIRAFPQVAGGAFARRRAQGRVGRLRIRE